VDCLILDYTGLGHDIFSPEIGEKKPSVESEAVDVVCPQCGYSNEFWGIKQGDVIIEHYGRKCLGAFEDVDTQEVQPCGYLFRSKRCPACDSENDISRRYCSTCNEILVDPDAVLKEAMSLKDAHILRCDSMAFVKDTDKKGTPRLEVKYYDIDGEYLSEYFYFDTYSRRQGFYYNFVRSHIRNPGPRFDVQSLEQVYLCIKLFAKPRFIVARKFHKSWIVREKIFDWETNLPRQEEFAL
jgi:DNA repair protein RadD